MSEPLREVDHRVKQHLADHTLVVGHMLAVHKEVVRKLVAVHMLAVRTLAGHKGEHFLKELVSSLLAGPTTGN